MKHIDIAPSIDIYNIFQEKANLLEQAKKEYSLYETELRKRYQKYVNDYIELINKTEMFYKISSSSNQIHYYFDYDLKFTSPIRSFIAFYLDVKGIAKYFNPIESEAVIAFQLSDAHLEKSEEEIISLIQYKCYKEIINLSASKKINPKYKKSATSYFEKIKNKNKDIELKYPSQTLNIDKYILEFHLDV